MKIKSHWNNIGVFQNHFSFFWKKTFSGPFGKSLFPEKRKTQKRLLGVTGDCPDSNPCGRWSSEIRYVAVDTWELMSVWLYGFPVHLAKQTLSWCHWVFYFLPFFVATEKEMLQKISTRPCRYDSTCITSNCRHFGCPIVCTDSYSQCYYGCWHLVQWLTQSSALVDWNTIFINNC